MASKSVKIAFLASFFVSLLLAVFGYLSFRNALGSDLVSYLTGALAIREGYGTNLYNYQTQAHFQAEVIKPFKEQSILPFHNFPLLAAAFIPLTYFNLLTAYKLFVAFLFIVLGAFSYISTRTFKNIPKGSFWFIVAFLFYPSLDAAFSGQVTLLILFLLLSIFIYLKKGEGLIAGALSSLLLLKVQYVIFVPFLVILTKDKKALLKGFLASSGVIFLSSVLISGWDFFSAYPQYVLSMQRPEFGIRVHDMFTLFAFAEQIPSLSFLSSGALMAFNLIFYLFALYFFSKKISKKSLNLSFATAVLLTLLFAVHGVNHDLALLLIPIFVLLNIMKSKKGLKIAGKTALFTLFLVPFSFPLGIPMLAPLFLGFAALLFFLF